MAHEKKPYNFTPNPHAGIGYTLQSPYSYKHIGSSHHFVPLVFVGSWVCDYDINKCRIIYSWARSISSFGGFKERVLSSNVILCCCNERVFGYTIWGSVFFFFLIFNVNRHFLLQINSDINKGLYDHYKKQGDKIRIRHV